MTADTAIGLTILAGLLLLTVWALIADHDRRAPHDRTPYSVRYRPSAHRQATDKDDIPMTTIPEYRHTLPDR